MPHGETSPSRTGLSRQTLGMGLGFIGIAIFGGTLPATRLAVEGLDPFFITAGRAAASGLLSAALLLMLRRRWPNMRQIRTMLICIVTIVFGFPGLMALAMLTVPASHGGVVLGILPLTTAAAASVILGERPSLRFWLLAGLGTTVVVAFALRDSGGEIAIGDIYLFLAAISTSIGYVFSADLSHEMPGWEVISWILVLALPLTLPLAIWLWPADPGAVPTAAWVAFAYVSVFSMFVGFFAWNAGLVMGGVARVSQVQLLQTFVTLGLSAVINGEHVGPSTIAVAALVVAIVAAGRNARITRKVPEAV
ncbi:DMT family transporter [[Pseudomonas] carboxydohydrogena]|uniref:DMT family transporter n=1 Tax=Afipia carboxydohydrogena TaxID=290 RepID=A0ABY8BNR7_AFICR|nr:DMT family transporter [[Pseudomonas] carboxydohydrogena]WEF51334.1 DMT family transporter [[Pseudomonas] carboxydohydrogena]